MSVHRATGFAPVLALVLAGCQFHVAVTPIGTQPESQKRTLIRTPPKPPGHYDVAQPVHQTVVYDAESTDSSKGKVRPGRIKQIGNWKRTDGRHPERSNVQRTDSQRSSSSIAAAVFTDESRDTFVKLSAETPPAPGVEPELLDSDAAEVDPTATRIQTQPIETASYVDADSNRFPINLASVLQLAGAENWQIHLAAERVNEAEINLDAAQAAWLPSLIGGFGYTKHDGKLQQTTGEVIDVSRNSVFVGGGARSGEFPAAGGSGGPARLAIGLSLTDALYRPLVARQLVSAEEFRQSATHNDTLMQAALAYYDLIFAAGHQENLRTHDLPAARKLLQQTEAFVGAGRGSKADVTRVRAEVTQREQNLLEAEASARSAGAELARILQLDPQTSLFALEDRPTQIEMFESSAQASDLVALAINSRPELGEHYFLVEAGDAAADRERWRPFLPNVNLTASAGGFGGGVNDSVQNFDGRSDFDILAVWQLDNLGLGNLASQQRQQSRHQQSLYRYHQVRDQVVTEVTQTYHQTRSQRRQIELAESQMRDALETFEQSAVRIRALAGLPLEALQAVQIVATARENLLRAIVRYNQSQFRLMRAVGGPIQEN